MVGKAKRVLYGAAMTAGFMLVAAFLVRTFAPGFGAWFSFQKGA